MKFKLIFILFLSVTIFTGCTKTTTQPEVIEPALKIAPKASVEEIPQIPVVDRANNGVPTIPPPPPAPPAIPGN